MGEPQENPTSNNGDLPCEDSIELKNCWNCKEAVDCVAAHYTKKFFCQGCALIQPPVSGLTYFDYFGMRPAYDLDLAALRKKYKSLQFLLHPDRYGQKSEKEKQFSADQAATVNRAYRTLLNPLSRGLYLLELNGNPLEEQETIQDNPEFLMEMMELNEEVFDAETDSELAEIAEKNKVKLAVLDRELGGKFENGDFEGAKEVCVVMRYWLTLDKNVQKRLGFDSRE